MEQYHFDFKDWEQAFEMFYRKRCGYFLRDEAGNILGFRQGDDDFVFVLSIAPEVSGYWIEKNPEPDEQTEVYSTVEEVKALEQRIRQQRAETVNLSLGGVIV